MKIGKRVWSLVLGTMILVAGHSAKATLSGPGDLVFLMYNADAADALAFVLLVDADAGQVVYFTDNEWDGANLTTGEGFISWTVPAGGLAAGTVVRLNAIDGASPSASVGTAADGSGSLNLSGSGDGLWAYMGTEATPSAFFSLIEADAMDGNTTNNTGLLANHFLSFANATDAMQYTGLRSGQAAFADYLSLTGDEAGNWATTTGDGTAYNTYDTTAFTTSGGANDADSTVAAPVAQIAADTVSSISDTLGESENVFNFTITDAGSGDGLDTIVTQITIVPGANNTADWTDTIQGVALDAGGAVTIGAPTITDTGITIPITAGNLDVADGTSEDVTLSIYMNTSAIVDGAVLHFQVDDDPHNFTADASGSTFETTLTDGAVDGNDQTVAVVATELRLSGVPAEVGIASDFSLTVNALDANGNMDTDATTAVTLSKASGTETLSSATGLGQSLSSGTYTWTDLQYSAAGDFTVQTTSGLTDDTTGTITASSTVTLLSESFETDGSGGARYTLSSAHVNDNGGGDYWERGTDSDFAAHGAGENPLNSEDGTHYVGGCDLDAAGISGASASVTLNALSVAGYTDLKVSVLAAARNYATSFDDRDLSNGDYLDVEVNLDGGGWTLIGSFCTEGDGLSNTSYLFSDADLDGDGGEVGDIQLDGTFQDFEFPVGVAGASMLVRVTLRSDAGNEDIFFDSIRVVGTMSSGANDGDGSATVANSMGASPLDGARIFRRNQSGTEEVEIVVTAVPDGIEGVQVSLPAGWDGLDTANVTLTGAGFAGGEAVTEPVANTLRITGASLTDSDTGTITITGLTSRNSTGLTDDGNDTWTVKTRASIGGIFTDIASLPTTLITIPIENMRDVDANGVPLDDGDSVAVEGVATVTGEFHATDLVGYMEDGTAGVNVYNGDNGTRDAMTNSAHRYVVSGTVILFNGLTEVSAATNDVYDLGLDAAVTPADKTLAEVMAAAESLEGSLLNVTNLSITSGTWPTAGNGGSLTVTDDGGTTELTLYIDEDTDIGGSTAPNEPFSAIGVLGQSDTGLPYTEGYRLIPRSTNDLTGAAALPAVKLVFTSVPANVAVGQNFSVTVRAQDASDNLVDTNANVTLSKASGPGILTGGGSVTLSGGTYTWTTLQYNMAATFTLGIADDGGLLTGDQSSSLTASVAAQPYDVIVNEMSQGSAGSEEWMEFLVTVDNVDMRGWELGDNDDGSWGGFVTLSSHSDWSSVARGTLIVVYNPAEVDGTIAGEDTDFSDKSVTIAADNSTYFSGGWGAFGNTDRDDTAAVRDQNDAMIHDMAVTHGTATVGSPGSGNVKWFAGDSRAKVTDDMYWTEDVSTEGTPGEPNGGNNSLWVLWLRGLLSQGTRFNLK